MSEAPNPWGFTVPPEPFELRRESRNVYSASYSLIAGGFWAVHLLADGWEQACAAAVEYGRAHADRFAGLSQVTLATGLCEIVHVAARPRVLS